MESPVDPTQAASPELVARKREPILTLPPALTAYILLLAVIHLRVLLPEWDDWTIGLFSFIPLRYDSSFLEPFPGGVGAKIWTFVTYSLLHGNLLHLGMNVLWLLPFGSALAQRLGALRFFLFMAVTAAAGALAHLVTPGHAGAPLIGASASAMGAVAGVSRFAFRKGSFLSFVRGEAQSAATVPALTLSQTLRDSRVLTFLAGWFVIILIGALPVMQSAIGLEGASIAWQAHIGGFLAGLLLFSLFDPVPRPSADA